MKTARINGRKLVLIGGLLLLLVAASARIFAHFYRNDMRDTNVPATQPADAARPLTSPTR